MKRLYALLTASFVCAIVLAQHPHSRGGNPLYWAIVGGIGALLVYAFYWSVSFILSLFKRHRRNCVDDGNAENQMKETTTTESAIVDVHEDSENVVLQSDEDTKINTSDNPLPKEISHIRTKRQKITIGVISVIMCLLAVVVVELHINNKRDRLFSEMLEQVRNSLALMMIIHQIRKLCLVKILMILNTQKSLFPHSPTMVINMKRNIG